jgi:transposase-like protein
MKKHAMWSELKDYHHAFKLQIVQEIERGQLTVLGIHKDLLIQNRTTVVKWLRKFGNFD